ncbi:MAG: hypothetical protein ABI120_01465 [Gemmatimonadaceae bacterium]
MRTTIDLDDSLLKRLRDDAHEQGVPFRVLLHRVIQRGLDAISSASEKPYETPRVSLGQVREGIDLVKALQLATTIEDEEIIRKIAERR